MTKKVAVALSGGIDSAVTAALLIEKGYDVIGITGKMTCSDSSQQVVSDAKKVADKLNIPHFAIDVSKEFSENVIKYFETSYQQGKTPNPCIMCNKYIKWGSLFDYAVSKLEADYIATGHYAKIIDDNGVFKLYPASDEHKDQLYFLFLLSQRQLSRTLFPLSEYKKSEVRILAEKYDLPPKSAKESQDICFIKPPMTTKKYLNNIFKPQQGEFIEKSTGKILGIHNGFWQYTIGQRKGIGLAAPEALYVTDIQPETNTVIVGYKKDLEIKNLVFDSIIWSYPGKISEFEAMVKIRYNMKPVRAKIYCKDKVCIEFQEPVAGIASGQACVLYDIHNGHLLGGNFIP